MNISITPRDIELVRVLDRARWLTTRQIHNHYFGHASVNACQKRLRKLAEAAVITTVRPSRTEQSLWRIAKEGIARLQSEVAVVLGIPKRIPGNLDHFVTINECRLWFMRHFQADYRLNFFLAEWELKAGRQLQVVPDALASIQTGQTSSLICLEVDLGTENPAFFKRTKLENYSELRFGKQEMPSILILVPGRPRMMTLIRQLYGQFAARHFFIAEIEPLLAADPQAPSLISLSDTAGVSIRRSLAELLESPHQPSSREETLSAVKS